MKLNTILYFSLIISSLGSNNLFLPGDSLFHTRITEKVLKEISTQKQKTFTYQRPNPNSMSACGYSGYGKIEVKDFNQVTINAIKKVYEEKREWGKLFEQINFYDENGKKTGHELIEINGLHLFIYDKEFDFKKFFIGLKYNENWVDEIASFGHSKEHVYLESFLPEYISSEWRDSTKVPPLKTTAKVGGYKMMNKGIIPSIKSKDCIFIITDRPIKDIYKNRNGTIYIISGETTQVYDRKNSKWILREKI